MTSISGGIAFSGLGSNGLDYEAIIKQEKSIKEIPKKRLEAWQADWQLRYDAFDSLLTSVQTLSEKLSALSSVNDFLQKVTSSTNGSVATVTAGSNAADGTYTIDVKELATNAVLTNYHVFSGKDEIVTGAAQPPVFSYDYKGETYSVSISENCSLEYLVTKINSDQNNPGVTASLIKTGDGYIFQLQGKDTGADADLSINSATNLPAFKVDSSSYTKTLSGTVAGSDVLNPEDAADNVQFSFLDKNGTQIDIDLEPGDDVNALVTKINGKRGETGVKAMLVSDGNGGTRLQLEKEDGGAVTVVGNGTDLDALDADAWDTNVTPPSSWNKREAQNASFSVNGLDLEFVSESNTLSEVFEGLNITLLSTGKTQFTVATSTEDTKAKVEEFVEAYNELIQAFQAVDNYDEDKSVKTRATSKDEDGNYVIDYSSQFAYQKGGVLTGNYGVQTILSEIKQLISGRGLGFRGMSDLNDTQGDRYINLASIGIMVDTDEGSSTFGQLKLMTEEERVTKGGGATDPAKNPYRTLDMALEEDPQAVMNLLVGSSGSTDSAQFSYRGSIGASLAPTPGEYAVEYTITTAGTPPDYITVGGIQVPRDASGSYIVPSGPVRGVEISVDDLSAGTVSSTLRIKQGKIPQLAAKLKDELSNEPLLKDPETGLYGVNTKRGGLVILKENYKSIMESIQKKIDDETTRIQTWETRERLRYSRLDTLLGNYSNMMSSNAAALGTSSSSSDS